VSCCVSEKVRRDRQDYETNQSLRGKGKKHGDTHSQNQNRIKEGCVAGIDTGKKGAKQQKLFRGGDTPSHPNLPRMGRKREEQGPVEGTLALGKRVGGAKSDN